VADTIAASSTSTAATRIVPGPGPVNSDPPAMAARIAATTENDRCARIQRSATSVCSRARIEAPV